MFPALSKAYGAHSENGTNIRYSSYINQNSRYIWWDSHLKGINGAKNVNSGFNWGAGAQSLPLTASLSQGRDGAIPRSADYINGYNQFKSAESVDVSLILGGGSSSTVAVHLINNIAEYRKDCIAVLSPPQAAAVNNSGYAGAEVDSMVTFRNLLPSTSYATLDSGWKYQYDKYNDLFRYVPCNGDTAGTMVRTDIERDPWWSPAGYNRGQIKNVVKMAYNPNKTDRDQLYKYGINPIVTFPGEGTILFGDKTLLSKPSAFDRINVRRLFIVLEKAIATASKYTLFEFNDAFTRAQFKAMVEPFLRDVQGRRGITDFRVVCDETNNTPEVIDRNEFVGDIYIKPARSINFIQLNFVAVRTGVDFTEVVGKF
jgi:phage tail sheath protein FI